MTLSLALALSSACFGGGGDDGGGNPSDDGGRLRADAAADAAPRVLAPPRFDAGDTPYAAQIGVADEDEDGGRTFAPHADGGPIPIGGVGQAGLTARLAIRLTDPAGGTPPDRVLVELVLINAFTGVVAESKPWGVAVELECEADRCEQPLVLVEITHLAKLPELPGLLVFIQLTVRDADDPERVLARAQGSGVLSR